MVTISGWGPNLRYQLLNPKPVRVQFEALLLSEFLKHSRLCDAQVLLNPDHLKDPAKSNLGIVSLVSPRYNGNILWLSCFGSFVSEKVRHSKSKSDPDATFGRAGQDCVDGEAKATF